MLKRRHDDANIHTDYTESRRFVFGIRISLMEIEFFFFFAKAHIRVRNPYGMVFVPIGFSLFVDSIEK